MKAENQRFRARALSAALSAFCACLPVSAFPAGPGTSAATFLNLGFGARPLGLAEAFVAMADDVSAVHYNPAGLSLPQSASKGPLGADELLFTHTIYIQQIALDQLGFVRRPWGFSVTNLRVGDIESRTTETQAPDGRYGAYDLAIGASYGRKLGDVGVGATLKYIRQSIDRYSADAYAADFGAIHRFESRPVSVGMALSNLGGSVRFVDQSAPLPLTLKTAVTYGMTRDFPHALSLQVDVPRDSDPILRFGAEYRGFGPFTLRAGYRTFSGVQKDAILGKALGSTASGFSEFYGLYLGMGLETQLGNLDYSIMPYGELGLAHRLSLALRFGK